MMFAHPTRHNRIGLALLLVPTLLILGCGAGKGGAPSVAPGSPVQTAPFSSLEDASGFPDPLDLFALLSEAKQPAYTADDLWQAGSDYNPLLPANHVSDAVPNAVFDCMWDEASSPTTADLAYAFYTFNLPDYDLPGTLLTSWNVQPADLADLWIGFGDLSNNAWDWHGGTPSRAVNTGGFGSYIDPATDQMLVAVVLMGGGAPELSELRLGGMGGTGELGTTGGTLNFGDASITAPIGALLTSQQITYTPIAPPAWVPGGFEPIGFAHDFDLSDDSKVESPLIFELPFESVGKAPSGKLAVISFDPEMEEFQLATIRKVVAERGKILIHSRYAPVFIVGRFSTEPSETFSLDFDPAEDGWEVENFGNYFSLGGSCLGMSGYAVWFFDHYSSENLWGKFSTAGGEPTSTTHLMCTRAHMAQSQYWARLDFDYQQTLADVTVFEQMKFSIEKLGRPVILAMTSDYSGHACVAYGWDSAGLLFYDVNYPGQTQTLVYGEMTGFGTYEDFEKFGYVTTPALGRPTDYWQLTSEGEEGFSGSDLLEIYTPQPDELVTNYSVGLTGGITGPANPFMRIVSYSNGVRKNVNLDGGDFSGTLPVFIGDLDIVVLAGEGINRQSSWYPNGAIQVVRAVGAVPQANMSVSMSWLDADLEFDLYITEPGGETAWQGNPATSNGLEFQSSFYSESSTYQRVAIYSTSGDTILPGLYDVRVHCVSNTTGAPASYSVSVGAGIVDSSPDSRGYFSAQYFFVAEEDDALNFAPGSTGPDWDDIVQVDVANGVVY